MSVSKLLGALSPQEVIKKVNEIIDNMGSGSSFSGSYNDLTDKPTIPDVSNMVTSNTAQNIVAKKSQMVIGEKIQALMDGASISFDGSLGNIATLTITQPCSISFTSVSGDTMTLLLTNGGSQTVTWVGVKWVGGTAPTLTASGVDCITIINIGGVLYGISAGGFA